jgi:hypothetical protein
MLRAKALPGKGRFNHQLIVDMAECLCAPSLTARGAQAAEYRIDRLCQLRQQLVQITPDWVMQFGVWR